MRQQPAARVAPLTSGVRSAQESSPFHVQELVRQVARLRGTARRLAAFQTTRCAVCARWQVPGGDGGVSGNLSG